MVSDGKPSALHSEVLLRLNNCSDQDAALNVTLPGAQYLEGEFSVMSIFKSNASYSRPGTNPQRQLLLSRRENVERVPESCAKSNWLFLHINSSDYEDAESIHAPEFFGNAMACTDTDVVGNAFKHGQAAFELQLLPPELSVAEAASQPAVQGGTLALSVPSCSKPLGDLEFGTVETPGIYSLHPCECFGEAYANAEPVDPASNAAAPRNAQGAFNKGTVPDQRLFSGPYTCEETASLGQFSHIDLASCQKACSAKPECQFYLFGKTSEICTLLKSCNYVQDVGLQVVNELYGMVPQEGSYCHIANPRKCWQEIKRRSMLSFSPSNLPPCLFQKQFEACDTLQLILGKEDGPCMRCQYIDTTSPDGRSFAAVGMSKIPLPEIFPPASQISVGCNDTSRMFARLQHGLQWEGPRESDSAFTCVSGEWIGEQGPWQYLSNFTCQRCIQVGDANLQRLSLVSMPEIYFLERRVVHVTYPFSINGCTRASAKTASPLVATETQMFLDVAKDQHLQLEVLEPESLWWIDSTSGHLRVRYNVLDPNKEWCICDDGHALQACLCDASFQKKDFWLFEQGVIRASSGTKCLQADKTLAVATCPNGRDLKFIWYFKSGNCFFGFDLSNTAQMLWTATVETAAETPPLRLGNLAFKETRSEGEGLFQIYIDYPPVNAKLCLHADLTMKLGQGYMMQMSSECRSTFLWRGAHIAYFHLGDLKTTYYLQTIEDDHQLRLIAAKQTTPGPEFNFVVSGGKIMPASSASGSKQCLRAKSMKPSTATTSNGLRSLVIEKGQARNYTACTSYGEFSGFIKQNGWSQVCRESGFLNVEHTSSGFCVTQMHDPPLFGANCDDADDQSVLTDVKWPSSISPDPHGIGPRCSARCARLGSSYVMAEKPPVHSYDAHDDTTTGLVNFTCPSGSFLASIRVELFPSSHSYTFKCIGPWGAVFDTSSPNMVLFEECMSDSDVYVWTETWTLEKIGARPSSGTWTELEGCEASVSVAMHENPDPNADAQGLNLSIPDFASLSVKEKAGYTRAPGIHVTTHGASKVLFTCLPGHAEGPVLDGNRSTLCAENIAVKASDLSQSTSLFADRFQTLIIQKSCPVLMEATGHVDPSIAVNTAKGGMTMQQLSQILRLAYHATQFGDPHLPPFNYRGPTSAFAEVVGFISLQPNGAPWGLTCPPGAVVASGSSTMPYCVFVDASEEKVFYAFSGSMSCPDGTAVSGWYNLPGTPVKGLEKGSYGGPQNKTGLRLFCRSTALLSSCQNPTASSCQGGGIVASVAFDSNQFKLGCCKLQRRIGMALTSTPRLQRTYQDFEGYYCPSGMDTTGAPSYVKTQIPSLGSLQLSKNDPKATEHWTLSWNRFFKQWDLFGKGKLVASLPGEDESPVAVNASGGNFSATFIEFLTAAYVMGPKPKSPFPSQKPKPPVLQAFHAQDADYKEYCNPFYLQNPFAYPGSIEPEDPCYHTFHATVAELDPAPKKPLLKGITEQAFWQCSQRSKTRDFLSGATVAHNQKMQKMISDKKNEFGMITLGVELAAALVGMIPWGSYAQPGSKGAEEAQQEIGREEEEVVEQEVEREISGAFREGWNFEGFEDIFSIKQILKDALKSAFAPIGRGFAAVGRGISAVGRAAGSAAKNFISGTARNIGQDPWNTLFSQDTFKVAKAGIGIDSALSKLQPLKPPSAAALKNMSQEVVEQTVPKMSGVFGTDLQTLADASWKDCLPLQFGLSKVMCDLFCIDDAVRSGTTAVLNSLQESHDVLMNNIETLLQSQSKYLLWAIGTKLNPSDLVETNETLLLPDLMQELRDFPSAGDDLVLDREVLAWHQATGDELMSRITATSILNASTDHWPHRVKSMKAMLHHYHQSLSERLRQNRPTSSVAQSQAKGKLKVLSNRASDHRDLARGLHELLSPGQSGLGRASSLKALPLEVSQAELAAILQPVMETFLHAHEKHNTFTMLHLKALDQTDYAVNLAHNFSQCAGADAAALREVWQRAMRAEERTSEALLEAWSATLAASERLEVAVQDESLFQRFAALDFRSKRHKPHAGADCTNRAALAQQLYGHAVAAVVHALQPLVIQINILKVRKPSHSAGAAAPASEVGIYFVGHSQRAI
ncbi:unnamed protein product [Durusdinium trenchii]|uniref:Uncharacterized protein n=1 Tax=Durusdinium trenchii TaxID=1381693 RepID=A0ABP0IGW5_9DINO